METGWRWFFFQKDAVLKYTSKRLKLKHPNEYSFTMASMKTKTKTESSPSNIRNKQKITNKDECIEGHNMIAGGEGWGNKQVRSLVASICNQSTEHPGPTCNDNHKSRKQCSQKRTRTSSVNCEETNIGKHTKSFWPKTDRTLPTESGTFKSVSKDLRAPFVPFSISSSNISKERNINVGSSTNMIPVVVDLLSRCNGQVQSQQDSMARPPLNLSEAIPKIVAQNYYNPRIPHSFACSPNNAINTAQQRSFNILPHTTVPLQPFNPWLSFNGRLPYFSSQQQAGISTNQRTSRTHRHPPRSTKHFQDVPTACPEITSTPRCWDTLCSPGPSPGAMEFTIMSYNILADELLWLHQDLYSQCHDKHKEWPNRSKALLTQILAHNADIVCLQEVQEAHWVKDICKTLEAYGYKGKFKKKDNDQTDGCAILYKEKKFRLLKCVPVSFMRGGILDRGNIGLILILEPQSSVYSGKVDKVCVATTHLLFNPRRGDVKLAQLMVLLAEIDKHAHLDVRDGAVAQGEGDAGSWSKNDGETNNPRGMMDGELCEHASPRKSQTKTKNKSADTEAKTQDSGSWADPTNNPILQGTDPNTNASAYCPVILCGDFNSEPFSDFYNFITSGHLKYQGLICRLMCGQKEGQMGGVDRGVGRHLLPHELNISQHCQYIDQVKNRQNSTQNAGGCLTINSGEVFHKMNFKSVYEHFMYKSGNRVREVSTCHNRAITTVDYMFYSGVNPTGAEAEKRTESAVEGGSSVDLIIDAPATKMEPLVLLARYRLLTKREVNKMGHLPNAILPSDHLCLIAKFLLR
ncbi:unnamed protein product [Lymnaea stagnalis]|uniref:Endonuclease/exonuclease/phosphatase domain-containing protein n=1 Tax=Lymnaea stagnalis TaxID=6523 RepID=A0AAV2HNR9_LYMST